MKESRGDGPGHPAADDPFTVDRPVTVDDTMEIPRFRFVAGAPRGVDSAVEPATLADVVARRGPLSGTALVRLAISTLTALTVLHRDGAMHGDIRPVRVRTEPDGRGVLDPPTSGGICPIAAAEGETAASTAGETGGSPSRVSVFLAPEQLQGRSEGPWSDVFSWASVMVYAATGRHAFSASNPVAQRHLIVHWDPDLFAVPVPFPIVLTSCLRKDPARRPSSVEALTRLLDELRPGLDCDEDLADVLAQATATLEGLGVDAGSVGAGSPDGPAPSEASTPQPSAPSMPPAPSSPRPPGLPPSPPAPPTSSPSSRTQPRQPTQPVPLAPQDRPPTSSPTPPRPSPPTSPTPLPSLPQSLRPPLPPTPLPPTPLPPTPLPPLPSSPLPPASSAASPTSPPGPSSPHTSADRPPGTPPPPPHVPPSPWSGTSPELSSNPAPPPRAGVPQPRPLPPAAPASARVSASRSAPPPAPPRSLPTSAPRTMPVRVAPTSAASTATARTGPDPTGPGLPGLENAPRRRTRGTVRALVPVGLLLAAVAAVGYEAADRLVAGSGDRPPALSAPSPDLASRSDAAQDPAPGLALTDPSEAEPPSSSASSPTLPPSGSAAAGPTSSSSSAGARTSPGASAGSSAPRTVTSSGARAVPPPGRVVPAAFGGSWQGTVSQPSVTPARFPVVVTLVTGSSGGTMALPSLGCRASLTLSRPVTNARELVLAERVTSDPREECADTARVTLVLADGGTLRFSWQDADNPRNVASATLTRR